MKAINVIVGSRSKIKVAAVQRALANLGIAANVLGFETDSGLDPQPEGLDVGYAGALYRAESLCGKVNMPDAEQVYVGIENFVEGYLIAIDIACIVVIDVNGEKIVTTSSGVCFPTEYVEQARAIGFYKTTVGKVISEALGGDNADSHSTLTKGAVTREDTLVAALEVAFRQLSAYKPSGMVNKQTHVAVISAGITPQQALDAMDTSFPPKVLASFNEVIQENLRNKRSSFKSDVVVERMILKGLSRDEIFKNHWLDVEAYYREKGWEVQYDVPERGADGPSTFTFSVKK